MAFIDQMGYVVPLKQVAIGESFVCYSELLAIVYGSYRAKSLSVYTRVETSARGTFAGMHDGETRLFHEDTEVVRCSS